MVLFQVASRHLGRDNPSHADVPIVEYFLNRANGSFGGVVPNRPPERRPVGVGAAGLVLRRPHAGVVPWPRSERAWRFRLSCNAAPI